MNFFEGKPEKYFWKLDIFFATFFGLMGAILAGYLSLHNMDISTQKRIFVYMVMWFCFTYSGVEYGLIYARRNQE